MKITEFIQDFKDERIQNSKVNPNAVSEYIKKVLEVKDYIPFVEKQSVAQIVLESCAHISDGIVAIDSVQKYIIFTITVLATYTNLEFNGDETDLDAYDLLCAYTVGDETLLDAIIKTFEKEYSRCNDILNMMTVDLMAENNIEKQVGKFLSGFSKKIENFGDLFINNMSNIPESLNQLDIDKLADVISKIK